ncbi:MAG TPA: hypothetical protein VGI86_15810 [Acidimicrobiia bacterium]
MGVLVACSGAHHASAARRSAPSTPARATTTVASTTTVPRGTTSVAPSTTLPPPTTVTTAAPPASRPTAPRAPRVVTTSPPPTSGGTPIIPLTPRSDQNVEIHSYDGIITGSVPGGGGGFNVWAQCHGGPVRVVVDAFTPPPQPMGYWYLGVSVNDSQLLFNGKTHVGQVITGMGSRVRLFSQTVADDYRIDYHC